MIYHANTNQKKAKEAILISDVAASEQSELWDKQELYIKWSLLQHIKTLFLIYATNNRVSK